MARLGALAKRLLLGVLVSLAIATPAEASARLTVPEAKRAIHASGEPDERFSHIRCERIGPRKLSCDARDTLTVEAEIVGEESEPFPMIVYGPADLHVRCKQQKAEVFDFAYRRWSKLLTRC